MHSHSAHMYCAFSLVIHSTQRVQKQKTCQKTSLGCSSSPDEGPSKQVPYYTYFYSNREEEQLCTFHSIKNNNSEQL